MEVPSAVLYLCISGRRRELCIYDLLYESFTVPNTYFYFSYSFFFFIIIIFLLHII